MASTERPLLILVGGSPASGKTTLASWLAQELKLPLLSRDALKEVLMESLGSPSRARSRELGGASYALLMVVVDRLVTAAVGAVAESNFSHGLAEAEWRPFMGKARMLYVHCQASLEETRRRYIARAVSGERHPGHHDETPEALADFEAGLTAGRYQPLELGVPTLCLDTTNGYEPDLSSVRSFVLGATED